MRALAPLELTEPAFAALVLLVPAVSLLDPTMQRMIAGIGTTDAGALPDGGAGMTYIVPEGVGGTMQHAQRLIGTQQGALRWRQLRDFNVGELEPITGKTFAIGPDGNLTPLEPGLTIAVPDSWYPIISERIEAGVLKVATKTTAPGLHMEVPPIDIIGPVDGGPDGAAVPVDFFPGLLTQAQAMLAAWGRRYPNSISPHDYGADPRDFTGIEDPATVEATTSFQLWANATRNAGLMVDGHLTPPTRAELQRVTAEILASSGGGAGLGQPGGSTGGKPSAEKSSGSGGALLIAGLGLAATLLK